MTIEFHCPHCDKLLRTADDKAGVQANCPGCGEPVLVPTAGESRAASGPSLPAGSSRDPEAAPVPVHSLQPAADAAGEGATRPCPMCGQQIRVAATRCRHCGETFADRQTAGVPTRIDGGEAVSTAWEIYKNNIGILAAATLIMGGIWLGLYIAGQVVQYAILFSIMGAGGPRMGGPNGRELEMLGAIYGSAFVFGMLNFAVVSCYLQSGYSRLMLRIARGENAEIADLFSGGPIFGRVFVANFLFTLVSTVGLMMLVVPGVFLLLVFWPFMFVIVDRDVGVIESFRQSIDLTSGNYMAGVILGLVVLGAWFAGLLTCGIGLIFTYPLAVLALTVAYCRMSGQVVIRS